MIKNILIILFFGFNVHGQKLHHQMISAQHPDKYLSNEIIINQTIQQQSVSGNYVKNNKGVGQSYLYTEHYNQIVPIDIITTTYPNPISDYVNFKFSSIIKGGVKIVIFDLLGKVVFFKKKSLSKIF